MENVDKTIDAICNWVQKELKSEKICDSCSVIEMTNALAALITARAK